MQDHVAIVGAGPAGLSTARALKTIGIPFTIFEKHNDVGGIWDPENAGSPMYRSAHFISSKTMSGHEAFSMPQSYPDYPSHRQILAYIRSFAQTYGLYDSISFSSPVTKIERDGDAWVVRYRQNAQEHAGQYRWVVGASGTNWYPNRPTLDGEESFTGEIIHSVDYSDASSLQGQNVLVVGAGNSGIDIACDAAFAANAAYCSIRRGYHFVPKNIFGIPADVFGAQSSWMPIWLSQRIFGLMLRLLNGDLTRLGLQKPDHRVFESHPILNTQVLHYMQHGDLIAKPDIARLDGKDVIFEDGTRAQVDKIILATGYDWKLPYLDEACYEWQNSRPQTFMKIFNPAQPGLFINGFVETNAGAYKLFDEMALLIAKAIEAQAKGAGRAVQAYIEGSEPDLGGKVRYVKSARHTGYTNIDAYRRAMAAMRKRLGWPEPAVFYQSAPQNTDVARPA